LSEFFINNNLKLNRTSNTPIFQVFKDLLEAYAMSLNIRERLAIIGTGMLIVFILVPKFFLITMIVGLILFIVWFTNRITFTGGG